MNFFLDHPVTKRFIKMQSHVWIPVLDISALVISDCGDISFREFNHKQIWRDTSSENLFQHFNANKDLKSCKY
jgi:hypothetical protein